MAGTHTPRGGAGGGGRQFGRFAGAGSEQYDLDLVVAGFDEATPDDFIEVDRDLNTLSGQGLGFFQQLCRGWLIE
ncbi:class II aldolase/adducin domain-containing protein, partial [Alcaligenes faecalis subsp. faecalis NCIB 8687]